MEAYLKLTEDDLDVLAEDANTDVWVKIMHKHLIAEVRDLREKVKPRLKAIEVLCDAVDGLHDHNNKLRDKILDMFLKSEKV